jgi:DHA1 family bicyclomycin/chloramphenicol resistance-like MFS transporter
MKIMLVLALGFSGMFIFIAKSSYIYIEYFGISTDAFPFYFGISILTLMLLIRVNIKLLEKYKSIILIRFAIAFQMVTAMVFIFISNEINLYAIIALTAIYIGMNAFIYGNCTALALESFSKNAGVASSVIGVIQFGVGALITSVVLLFHTDNLTPVAVSIFLISSSSFVILRSYTKI